MSQNYKFKSLEIAKASQKKEIDETKNDGFKTYEIGESKTIDFVLLDGTRQNFPYSHYLTSWLGVENEERVIKIFFATHMVTVKGFCLDQLYNRILKQELKRISANKIRYEITRNDNTYITNIVIQWKGSVSEKK
ncbi:hypothetical protein [Winogradskyella sp. SYSU M77433]|uniref:hypothetical protein n=1 Tax=Winogradskyella sp. SYSU M77433 TaxID=3042722 RepID=UPI002480C523|nr:hypothetical protein [Winogradskyella sp. SYSU M77433]MDH7913466.1 hypothetical protein [Winogradskyella sp. SYSU M77433]